jgi:hypothetical protein
MGVPNMIGGDMRTTCGNASGKTYYEYDRDERFTGEPLGLIWKGRQSHIWGRDENIP